MTVWQYDSLAVWQFVSVTMLQCVKVIVCQSDRVIEWQSNRVTKWLSDRVTWWQSDRVTEWQSDKVTVTVKELQLMSDSVTVWQCNSVTVWHNDTVTLTEWQSDNVTKLGKLKKKWDGLSPTYLKPPPHPPKNGLCFFHHCFIILFQFLDIIFTLKVKKNMWKVDSARDPPPPLWTKSIKMLFFNFPYRVTVTV